jgi:hypothetical protein
MNISLEPSTLILGLALTLLFGAIVAIPLLDRRRPAVEPPSPLELLEAERAAVVRNIRELDFDHRTGKIEADDYKALRMPLLTRGAQLLQEIESMQSAPTNSQSRDIVHEIEDQIAQLRASSTRACDACAAVLRQDDKFCPQCGAKVLS